MRILLLAATLLASTPALAAPIRVDINSGIAQPLPIAVPAFATAPALLYVACLMVREFEEISWGDVTESAPAVLTALMMPFTYSIANGLAFGFVSYAAIKLLTGRARDVHAATWVVAALFVIRFAFFMD